MIKDFLEIGEIVGTHGVRGEMRLNPWCDSPEFATKFKRLYLDGGGASSRRVLSCRAHGNVALLRLEGVDCVEDAAAMRGRVLYISRADAQLPDGDYFVAELCGCRVIDADDESVVYGTLTNVSETGANDVWHVTGGDGREYLLPAIPPVVIDTNVETGIIKIRPLKGIFDNED